MGSWTPERVEILTTLWEKGLSARQIAEELGGTTRNAVIGKLYRMGLFTISKEEGESAYFVEAFGNDEEEKGRKRPSRRRGRVRRSKKVGVTLLELTEDTCRWPIGDPSQEGFLFCGAPPERGLPYCSTHAQAAYQASHLRRLQKKAQTTS